MSKKSAGKPRKKRTKLLALEPRMLFDGALGADLAAQANAAQQVDTHAQADAGTTDAKAPAAVPEDTKAPAAPAQADAGIKPAPERLDAQQSASQRNEVVFIDTTVEGYKDLLANVNPNAKVVLLDANRDGVSQIAEFLAHESNVDAVHIVSHGSEGMLQLGTTSLDVFSMARTYGAQLAEIGTHLSRGADILVYGCDFGKGALGNAAATELSWLTKADVAASTDLTGAADLGGNWTFERNVGAIETNVAFDAGVQRTFHNVLETLDWDKQTWAAAATSGSYALAGGTVTVTMTLRNSDGSLAAGNPYGAGYPIDGQGLLDGNLAQNSLQVLVKAGGFANAGQYVDISISFSQPGGVSNVSFALFDIDTGAAGGGSGGFVDKVTVSGVNSNGAIVPAAVKTDPRVAAGSQTWTTSSSPAGTVITGSNPSGNTGAGAENGTAVVSFDQSGITQINVRYQNVNIAYQQGMGLHDISFDAAPAIPQLDLNPSDARPFAGEAFSTASYGNVSTGTLAWSGNWVETDAAGGAQSATAGNVLVTGGELTLKNAGSAIQRAINLSPQSSDYLNRLSFDYRTATGVDLGSDKVDVQVSSDGGTTWTTLDTLDLGPSASGSKSYDITGFSTANTLVRFKTVAGGFTGGNETFYLDNVTVKAQPTSYATSYTEGGSPVNITNAASINDDSANMSGATITVTNRVAGDLLSASTAGTSITAAYNGATGVLTLSGADTRAHYEQVLRTVQFGSTSDDPTAGGTNTARVVSFVVRDSSSNASNTARTTVNVTDINDAPTLTATPANPTFTEGAGSSQAAAVSVFSAASISTVESGQGLLGLTFTVGGLQDGANERLSVDGTTITLGANSSGTTAGNAMSYTVTLSGGTATVALTKASVVSVANMQTLINGLTYQNTNINNPTAGVRTFTISSLRDNGGTASGGVDTASLSLASAVTVAAVNDAAVISGTTTGSVIEAGAAGAGTPTATGTLTSTDVDGVANAFTAKASTASSNGYGTYTMTAGGVWTYTLDNNNASVQALNVGQTLTDTFTVTAADGTPQVISVTINGRNDAATLSSASASLAETNAPLSTGGTLTISDVDSPQTFVVQTNVAGTYGTFSIATNGAWTYTASSAYNNLNVGQSVADTFTVSSADGTSTTVQVTINGTNDAAVLSSANAVVAETNAPLTTGGTLTITDVDSAQTFAVQTNVAGTYGRFSIASNGAWTYTANSAYDSLNVGQSVSDTFTVSSADGTTTTVQVTIQGSNDAAVLSSATVALSETNAPLSTGGTLTITDVDSAQTFVAQSNVAGTYGTFSLATNGAWTYTASSAYNNLNVGQSVSDTFTVSAADGTTTTVQVTINGTNDAAVLSSASAVLTETNAPLSTGGTLTITDVDSAQTFVTQSNVAGTYGTFSIATNGAWTYTANSAYNNLNVGQSVSDTFTVVSADGTTTTVQVTINGTNDAAVLSAASAVLSETNAPLSTGGTLTITDVDSAQTFVAQSNVAGTYGTFSIATNGAWTYTAGSAYNNLNVGQSLSDTFSVSAADGTSTTVQVTINGTNDAAVLSSASTVLTETNAPLATGGTLTISDVDSPQTFVAQTNAAGTYGQFSIAANGAWTYTANSAYDNLNVGQSISDTFTVAAADGTTTTVQVTINGTNDAAVLSSASAVLTETNAPLSTGGTLTITDVDSAQTFVPQSNVAGTYGSFSIAANGAWSYTASSAYNNLNVGQSVSDTFTVASADGTTSSVQVTIQGTNDAAVISSASVALSETNAPLSTGGTLTITDVDSAQTFVAQSNIAGTYGTFSIATNGAWTYTASSAYDNLNVGQSVSDTFTVSAADGTTTSVQVAINGTNDAAVLSSSSAVLTETNAPLSTGGTLTISDIDNPQTFVPQANVAGTYGQFSIAANGAWTYTANSAYDNLNVGQSISDTFTVSAADGTTTTVQVTINGTNDAAMLSSASTVLSETNAPLSTGGTLTISDVDSAQTFVAQSNVAGTYGTFSIAANGAWNYTAMGAYDSLNVGQSVSDTFTVASADGTTSTVQVTIQGTNDAAVVSSASVALAETNAPLTASGTLTVSDVDNPQTFVVQTNVAGTYGQFSVAANGAWTYTANSAYDNLNVGQSISDSFTVSAADGTTSTVQVTINGTNDPAVLASTAVTLAEVNTPVTTGGVLTVVDPDSPQSFIAQTNVAGTYGTFSLAANGAWTYTANSALDSLNVGQSVSDTFSVSTADGTSSSVQVTITGTNDAAVLSSATLVLAETNAPLATGGTLTISDVDNAPSFVAQSNVAGTYGTFSIATNGAWTYTANSAYDSLNVGQSVSDTFAVSSADGTTTTVQVTINGSNDAAVLSSASAVLAETNAPLTTGGSLTIADVDSPQTFVAQTNVPGTYGHFSIAANGAWTYTANSAYDNLNLGQSISDTFTVSAADGTTTSVQVTINGTNDAAVLSSASAVLSETNAPLSTGGTLLITDPDNVQAFVAQTNVGGTYGTFSIAANGAWTYTANSAYDSLNVGQSVSDTFTVTSTDNTTSTVQVTINGTNDAAVLSSASVGLTETNVPLSSGGMLTISDVDSAPTFVAQTNVAGAYGTFSIAANGAWTYAANSAYDNLNVGQSISDAFTVSAADGTTTTVQVTINGTNDAAVVSSSAVTLAETDLPIVASGTVTVTDVDNAASFVPQTNVAGTYGTFAIAANGNWTYVANSAFDNLNVGQSISETFTVTSADGSTGTVQVTITGTNDAAVVSSAAVALAETNAPLSASGTLSVSDVDNSAAFVAQGNVAGTYGMFSLAANGAWTYTANSAYDSLNVGQSVSDSFTVSAADGTTSTVQVTINGTNDAAVLSSTVVTLGEIDVPLQTGGTLSIADVDNPQTFVAQTNVAGTYGTFSIAANGAWTYIANSSYDYLNTGDSISDSFTVAATDGTTTTVQVIIDGTNDVATVSSTAVTVSETNAPITTNGTVFVSDVDNSAAFVAQSNVAGTYGTFSIAANGNWTYTANSAFDNLNVGDSISDTFAVQASDGTPSSVRVTITGTNDAAAVSSASVTLAETDAALSTGGVLTLSDVDNAPSFVAQTNVAGTYGTFSIAADGTWTYTANSAFDSLGTGQTISDAFTVASADGTSTFVQVTIQGTNDLAVVSSAAVTLAETDAPLSTGGVLSVVDLDSAQAFVPQTNVAGLYGTFSIAADGTWTYDANGAFDSLNVGQSVADLFTVSTSDGTHSTVQVTITGTNDAAVVSSASVTVPETNAAITTSGTLTISDLDNPAAFTPQANIAGTYGTFSIASNGAWTYTANDAYDSLNVGQSVSDTFSVAAADGTTSTVQVTISGTNDAAVVSSAAVSLAQTNAVLSTSGALTASDVDSPAAFVAQNNVSGTYGTFSIAADGSWSYSANSAFQNLGAGQSISDTFVVATADGTPSSVQVTINGTNDAAVISSASVVLTETDVPLNTGGTLTITDADSPATFVAQTNIAGTYGTFSIATNGDWSYSANSALDNLNVGQSVSDTFTVSSADGTTSTVQVTIQGSNDAAIVSSATVALAESNAPAATSGTLTVSDVDNAAGFIAQSNVAGTYGTFSLAANGGWTYTAFGANDSLNVGQSVSDTFTVASLDGTTGTVQVTINGTNDAAVIASAAVTLTETNTPLSTGGTLTASDVDSPASFVAQTNVAGTYGTFSIAANGAWTYTASSSYDSLNVGQSVSDSFTVSTADGTTSTVQVTITGTNDAAVLSSASAVLTETNAPVSTSGTLTVSDIDSASAFIAQSNVAGLYGNFSIGANGAWTYTANSAFDSLNVGQSVSDTFTVASVDGSTTSVQVTIQGTNDAAVVNSTAVVVPETNVPVTASGTLTITDLDDAASFAPQSNVAGTYGTFSIAANGDWTYTAASAFDSLAFGQSVSDTFTVAAVDGTTGTVQVTISGTNDAAVVSSASVVLAETNAPLSASGALSISDVDSPPAFVAQSNVAGTYGSFSIAANGAWSYTANSAYDNLNVGQSISDTFTVSALDGTISTVQVTINGTNDAAVVSSASAVLAETNAPLTTGGVLSVTDPDDSPTFVVQSNVAGTYGMFSIAADGTWSYTANSAYDSLNVGQSVSDTFMVAAADGTTSTVQVTINGTNDAALVSSATVTLAETNAPLSASGNLTVSDADDPSAFVAQTNVAGTYGTFSIAANGAWTYTATSAYDSLNVGQSVSDTFAVSAADGTTSTVQVTINGTNDAAVVSSATVTLAETNAPLSASGTLTVSDVDNPSAFVAQTNVAGSYGTFSIAANGAWSYTANSAYDNLNIGQSISDTFAVAAADGTTSTVQVTINGTNDAALVSSASVVLAETNAPITTGGTLTVTDPDDAPAFVAQSNVAGTFGNFSIAADGTWSYTANSAYDSLNVGQSVSDSFTVAAADGTTTTVQVTIQGTNDAALISSATVALAETNAPLSASGTLSVADADDPASVIPQSGVAGTFGTFSIAANGAWTYTANSAYDGLNVGQSVSDTFTVSTADGTTSTVQVTINGTNDAAAVSSATVTLAETNAPLSASGNLTVSDVDDPSAFVAQTNVAGSYGTFSIAANGAWSYAANSAYDNLNVGQSISDTFTVAAADGTTSTVQVTINGTNDAAVVSSASTVLAETNAPITTGGTLTIADPDDSPTFVAQSNVAGSYGTFSIAADGSWSYTASSTYDSLNVGQSLADTFVVSASDGTTSTVQVTIQGTNDAAVVSAASAAVAETNAPIMASGTLTVSDVDDAASFVPQTNVAGTYGTFSIAANGQWTYTASSAYDSLNVGQSLSDSFAVTTADGTATSVQVTITGTNDAAVLGSAGLSVAETNAPIGASGMLSVTDVDDAPVFVPQTNVAGTYGTFSIAGNGAWAYSAYSAYDSLNLGQSVSDTFSVASSDGTTSTVQITITGTNDAAVVSSASALLSETNAPLTAGGALTVSDPDDAQAFVPQTNVAGTYGTFSVAADGSWSYSAYSAYDNLNVGQSISETFSVASTDGTTSSVQVTIQGTNDAAVISSASIAVAETNAAITASGTLSVSDVDDPSTVVPQSNVAGAYGTFSIAANGQWTYTANSAYDSLNVGQSVSDTFTVSAADGTTTSVQVTISGTNDAAVVSTATTTLAETNSAIGASGALSITDVDDAAVFVAQSNVAGTYGTFSIAADGSWSYTAYSAYDNLNVGQSVSDTFTVAAADGTSSTVQVTITGTDDAAVISSANFTLNAGDTPASTGGMLAISDPDNTPAFVPQTSAGATGTFSLAADGSWTYTTNSVALTMAPNQSLTDSFTVQATDGSTAVVRVTVVKQFEFVVSHETLPAGSTSVGGGASIMAAAPASALQSAAAGGTGGEVAGSSLGLPVDGSVPASDFAAARIPQSAAETRLLSEYLQDTAGLAAGFPLVRMPAAQAEIVGALDLGDAATGQRLFVYHGIPDMQVVQGTLLVVPRDAFAHTDPRAIVILEARLADGSPLPSWIHFEGGSGVFIATPPQEALGRLELEVTARDTEGREAHTIFSLQLQAALDSDKTAERAGQVDAALGLDVDKQEAEKMRTKVLAAKERTGAPSFTEQMGAAKRRDPLLERIVRTRQDR